MENGDLCRNCGSASFVVDFERGDVCCEECGCCDEARLQVAAGTYKETHDAYGGLRVGAAAHETAPTGAIVSDAATERALESKSRHNSPPYRRATYVSERGCHLC
jgi:transcription initiation factor TFIIIB Brf1 subunit/transcription initiation factor TFIIB